MSEHSISTRWTCECATTNPLRKQICITCGRKIPDSFLNKVYKEEIDAHSIFFKSLSREREIFQCAKIGGVLTKIQAGTVFFLILAFFACNGIRFYFYPDTVSVFNNNYVRYRETRIENELPEFTKELANVKKVPVVFGRVWINLWDSTKDVKEGLSKDRNRETINEEKILHIAERIKEAKNYVTGKLR